MAQARIFQKGNNVQIVDEATGKIIALIPSRSFRFEPQENYDGFVIRDYEARERVRQYLYSEVLTEGGAPVGGAAAVIDYLAPLVGFNPAGGGGGEANTTSNEGPGTGLLAMPKVGVNLPFKTLVAGTNISIVDNPDNVVITASAGAGGEVNTSSNAGGGEGLALPKVGADLPFKTLLAGANISFNSAADTLEIIGAAPGEVNTNSNSGAGQGTLVLPKVGVDTPIKTILAGSGVTVTNNADTVEIAADDQGGEANTASSAGGTSLVLPKVGVDLPFKGLAAGALITITSNAADLNIAVQEGNIVHQNISGAGTNTHAQIDAHIADVTTNPHNVTKSQVGLANVDNIQQIPLTEKGAINGVATLGADGKVPNAQIPALAISETFVVASEAAQLALVAQVGDVAVRTDITTSFILQSEPASVIGNWVELLAPGSPVQSVNGQTGNVVLTTTDVNEGTNQYFTELRVTNTPAVLANTAKVSNATHTGDVTGSNALTIANNAVSNAKAADMPANTVKVRNQASAGDPVDLSMAASTILARLATGNVVAATTAEIITLLQAVLTSSNVGTGAGLALPKVGSNLPFKSLVAGTGITLTPNANDVTITANGGVMFETPAAITGSVNDYNPTNWTTSNYFRQGTVGNNFINGVVALPSGTERRFINLGPGDLRFSNENAGSLAANRILTPDTANITLKENGSCLMVYDGISSRWRIIQLVTG